MSSRIAIAAALTAAALAGCADDHQELRGWMEQQRRSMPVRTEPVPPPKTFEPFRYENAGQSDPFSQAKLSLRAGRAAEGMLKPDMNRRREVLESFPLESIRMVGHLADAKGSFALLMVDQMVYQARVGNYAGQNFGKIVRISETEVMLKELVQDAAGDWTERETTLQLQERPEKQEKKK